jgi:hypothetical protein
MHLLHHLGRPLERPRAGEDVNPSSRIASLKVGDEGRPAEDESAIEPKGEPEAEKAHSSPVEGIESPASKEPAPQRPSPHRRVCCIQAERRGGGGKDLIVEEVVIAIRELAKVHGGDGRNSRRWRGRSSISTDTRRGGTRSRGTGAGAMEIANPVTARAGTAGAGRSCSGGWGGQRGVGSGERAVFFRGRGSMMNISKEIMSLPSSIWSPCASMLTAASLLPLPFGIVVYFMLLSKL